LSPLWVCRLCVKQPALMAQPELEGTGMELEPDARAARGLRRYLRLVAEELGIDGAGQFVQFDAPVGAYLPLDIRLSRFPSQDVALVWDEERGWALGIETDAGTPIALLSYLGGDVLPAPRTVAQFVHDVVDDRFPGRPDPVIMRSVGDQDDLVDRLNRYAPPVLPVRGRGGWR
jgi:hypothetical protein